MTDSERLYNKIEQIKEATDIGDVIAVRKYAHELHVLTYLVKGVS